MAFRKNAPSQTKTFDSVKLDRSEVLFLTSPTLFIGIVMNTLANSVIGQREIGTNRMTEKTSQTRGLSVGLSHGGLMCHLPLTPGQNGQNEFFSPKFDEKCLKKSFLKKMAEMKILVFS